MKKFSLLFFIFILLPFGIGRTQENSSDVKFLEYPSVTREAFRSVRCTCGCAVPSLDDCHCNEAVRLKAEMASEIKRGKTPKEAIQAYLKKYGEEFAAIPSNDFWGMLFWIAPLVAFGLGGVWVTKKIHSLKSGVKIRRKITALDPNDIKKVEDEFKKWKKTQS